jgi:hypothetical protein
LSRKQVVNLIDDLDGKEITDGGRTVTFSLQGVGYEIDLSTAHHKEFRAVLEPYIAVARRVGPPRSGRGGVHNDPAQIVGMREWAKRHGFKVSDRGRVSREVQDAYHASH